MQPNKSVEEIVKEHLEEVQDEYNMGGLSDGLYGNYATEVAKRTVNTVLLGVVERVEKHRKSLPKNPLDITPREQMNSIAGNLVYRPWVSNEQSYNEGLDDILSLLNDQIISNKEKK